MVRRLVVNLGKQTLIGRQGRQPGSPKLHPPPIDFELRHCLNVVVIVQLIVQNRFATAPFQLCRPCTTEFDHLNGLPV
jgi:hypothetical protein